MRNPHLRQRGRRGTAVTVAMSLAFASPVLAAEEISAPQQRRELDTALAARKQAMDEKSRAYLEAHRLYKNCERELRPFCLLSAQMMMRNADARYKSRER